jgi:hypothetical protein
MRTNIAAPSLAFAANAEPGWLELARIISTQQGKLESGGLRPAGVTGRPLSLFM